MSERSKDLPVSTGGRSRVPPAAALLAPLFVTDPVITYMLCNMPAAARTAYMPAYFQALLTAAALNRATFEEVGDWSAAGVLMPPGAKVDNLWTILQAGFLGVLWNLGVGGCRRMLVEFAPLADAVKARALGEGARFFYVFFFGTRKDAQGMGLCSILVKHYQAVAANEGLPLWLEATTEHSMGVYKKNGFEVVEEFVLGKGKAGVDGTPEEGGVGVRVWGMVWRPPVLA